VTGHANPLSRRNTKQFKKKGEEYNNKPTDTPKFNQMEFDEDIISREYSASNYSISKGRRNLALINSWNKPLKTNKVFTKTMKLSKEANPLALKQHLQKKNVAKSKSHDDDQK
jgi:hypothetical protein